MPDPVTKLPIMIRETVEADLPFVFETWLNGYKKTVLEARASRAERARYFQRQRARIMMLLDRGARLHTAAWLDAPDDILGYICTEGTVVHFAHVKKLYRRQRVATSLLSRTGAGRHRPIEFTHMMPDAAAILLAHRGQLRYIGTDVPVTAEESYAERGQQVGREARAETGVRTDRQEQGPA